MTQTLPDAQTLQTAALLTCYGFDLRGNTPVNMIQQWLEHHSAQWIRLAVVEALYQGRYKAVSVDQLLKFWEKRGHPYFHFNHEFEHLISHNLPKILLQPVGQDENGKAKVPVPLPPPKLLEPILRQSPRQTLLPAPPLDFEPMWDEVEEMLPTWTEPLEERPWVVPLPALTETSRRSPAPHREKVSLLHRPIHAFSPQTKSSQGLNKLRQILNQELAQGV